MMELYEGLVAYLEAHAGLAPIFGDRIYPVGRVAPGVEPDDKYLTWQDLNDTPDICQDGDSGYAEPQIQLTGYFGRSPGAVRSRVEAQDALRLALDYDGPLGDVSDVAIIIESLVSISGSTDDGGPFGGEAVVVTISVEHQRTD